MQPKQQLPDETIAIRQLLLAGVISFPVGFVVTCAGMLWLRHRLDPGAFWSWTLFGWVVHCLEFGFLGGLGFAAAAVAVLNRRHYRVGYHRCSYCGRPRLSISYQCTCPAVAELELAYDTAAERDKS